MGAFFFLLLFVFECKWVPMSAPHARKVLLPTTSAASAGSTGKRTSGFGAVRQDQSNLFEIKEISDQSRQSDPLPPPPHPTPPSQVWVASAVIASSSLRWRAV